MEKEIEENSIYKLLQNARTELVANDDCMRQLLSNLTGINKKKWARSQCLKSYENILRHYINDEQKLDMLLSVSGIKDFDDDYADARRDKYIASINASIANDTQRRREDRELKKVAKRIQKDIDSGEINSFLEEWIPDFKEMQNSSKGNDYDDDISAYPGINITNINASAGDESNHINKTKKSVVAILIILIIVVIGIITCVGLGGIGNLGFINLNMHIKDSNDKTTIINGAEDHGFEDASWPNYTIDQINADILDDRIVFNSVDDERNFVSVRKADSTTSWETDTIIIENNDKYDDEEFEVCVRVKNDNPNGTDAIAEDTMVFFEMPQGSSKTIPICACIQSENAKPKTYTDDIKFSSYINFRLEYVEDSAVLINQENEKDGGIKLGDIFREDGNPIGYKLLDGRLPGGDEYASTITFKVKAVFDAKAVSYTTTTKVRLVDNDDKTWKKEVGAKLGDKVEFQIEYKNTGDSFQKDVIIRDILPKNLRYIPGSSAIYNTSHPKGAVFQEDDLVGTGVFIGSYAAGTNAFVRFQAEVVNDSFTCGRFILYNWGRASVGEKLVQDSAQVIVQLDYCPDPESSNMATE